MIPIEKYNDNLLNLLSEHILNTTGFDLGSAGDPNGSGTTYASWTFRKQPKFFDVVTYTGTGANRTVAHSLGSVPGCIIVKRTDTTGDWQVYHRSLANTQYLVLNSTAAAATGATRWNSTTPTDTVFSLGTDATVNASGGTYVAYIYAHDAGGFGLTGTDNVITCGSYTGTNPGPTLNFGWEPQWIMIKGASGSLFAQDWVIIDNMRGMSYGSGNNQGFLLANTFGAESNGWSNPPTATGITLDGTQSINDPGKTYIYIAIRRGPMKVPTTGTSVFGLNARTGTGANVTVTGGAGVTDLAIIKNRGASTDWVWVPRMTAIGYMSSNSDAAQVSAGTTVLQDSFTPWSVMDGLRVGTTSNLTNASGNTFINYLIGRAPGFMDVVCYTGTGSNTTQNHNLGVVPELMLVKGRSATTAWQVYSSALANTEYLVLNTTAAKATGATRWNSTTPTSSVFSIGTASEVNTSAATYVAYLFASAPGVSKVGSYTGNGTTQAIACGFTGGARFVLIKRTDSTGDWYVYDTARGMTIMTDPYLLLNSTAAETATLGSVITSTGGFTVNSAILAAINTNAATYIFLAIA
jgi:hypothetical protein